MRAARVDANQNEIVKALRDAGASVAITSRVGDGFPDLVVGFREETYLMELKMPRSGLKTSLQEIFFLRWCGGSLNIVKTPEEALNIIGVLK